MRKLRAKQRGPKCSFCENKATHRSMYFNKYGCADHLAEVQADTDASVASLGHQSEAEFQLGL